MPLSKHAEQRTDERSIDPLVVDLLLQYGAVSPAPGACVRRYFDKKSRKTMKSQIGPKSTDLLAPLLDAALVQARDTGAVVTVYRRDRRVKR